MSLFSFLSRRALRPTQPRRRLTLEYLETREVPAVTLADVPGSDFPTNKPLFVPITATSSDGQVFYSVSSKTAGIAAEVVQGGHSVRLTVSGTDSNGAAFSGDIVIRLFEADAPLSTGNIISLVNQGYYDGKLFHRVVNDFVIQGGSPNGDGKGGSSLVSDVNDEYNANYTFASRGIVAMANAGDDNNNAQFFITDPFIVSGGKEVTAPLDRRSEALNFNHTIVGIVTSGFDIYQQIMNVPRSFGSDGAISKPNNPVTITDAVVFTDDRNGVIKITATGGFTGSAEIFVSATEGASAPVSKSFTVNSVVDTVNDRPFLGTISNLTTTKNTATQFTISFTELDAGDTQTFAIGKVLQTTDGSVWSELDSTKATASVDASGKVTITPAAGFVGTVSVTVGVRDATDRVGSKLALTDARNFDTQTFTLTVNDTVNTAPTISNVANQSTAKNVDTSAIAFTVGDAETPVANLTVTAASSNLTLLPLSSIVIAGTGANRTVTIKSSTTGQTGSATVTLTVTDGDNLTAVDTFDVTYTESTTAPTISDIANQSTKTSTATGAIAFTVGDAETPAADLTVTFSSSNLTLIPLSGITIGGSGANRTITLNPASGQNGTATITVTVKDASNASTSDTFTFTVTAPVTVALTSSKTVTSIGRPILFTATVSSGAGTVQFLDGTTIIGNIPVVEGKALLSTSFSTSATHPVTAKFIPSAGETVTSSVVNITITNSTAPVVITAEGASAGGRGQIRILNQDGTQRSTATPFSDFTGGEVRVKVADVTNDGQLDVVAVPGAGGSPIIVVYDGATGAEIFRTMIFESTFRGGLNVDVGDAKGLGYAQILIGAGVTGGPRVNLYDAVQRKSLLNYFAYDSTNRGGVTVALSDLRGGNFNNIITGAGTGLAPNVNVYNPYQIVGFEQPDLYGTFIAGSKTDTTGIRIGTGPLIDNSRRDVLVGPVNPNTAPLSQSFDPVALGVFVD